MPPTAFPQGAEQSLCEGLRCSEDSFIQPRKWVRDVASLWSQANTETHQKSSHIQCHFLTQLYIRSFLQFCSEIFFFFWEKGSLLLVIMKSAVPFSPPASPQISVWLPGASGIPHSACADNSGMAPFLLNEVGKSSFQGQEFLPDVQHLYLN